MSAGLLGPGKNLMRALRADGHLKMFRNPNGQSHLLFTGEDGRLIRISLGTDQRVAALAALLIDVLARTDKSFKPTRAKLLRLAGGALKDTDKDET